MELIAFIISIYLIFIAAMGLVASFKWLWRLGTPEERGKTQSFSPELTLSADEFFEQTRKYKEELQKRRRTQLDQEVNWGQRTPHPYFGRIIYENLVIDAPSSNTPHTEIDEVILTPYGIFCIEYKAHTGIIFGSERQKIWTQCKFDGKYPRHNPLHQNYKHVKALEHLLKGKLKAPIHSFVVYTNAHEVNVDSKDVFSSIEDMEARISNHTRQVYNLSEYNDIARELAIANAQSAGLFDRHVEEVNEYLATLSA